MDALEIEPIAPEPFPDGRVEMHADGGGLTVYRLMTREAMAALDAELARHLLTYEGR